MSLEARPLVQRITLQPAISSGSGSGDMKNESSHLYIALNISKYDRVVDSIVFSPASNASEVEYRLNQIEDIRAVGRVTVLKDEDRDMSNTISIQFTVIYLTQFEVSQSMVPIIKLDLEQIVSCGGIDYMVDVETIQTLTYPSSFKIGFNANSQQYRQTTPLPLNASSEMLRSNLTELLSWGCTEEDEESIAQKTILYEKYESEGEGRTRDNSTSFCGFYSNRNPVYVWRESNNGTYRLNTVPYVRKLTSKNSRVSTNLFHSPLMEW